MNILITGADGQLGTELSKILPNAIPASHKDLDITKFESVRDFTAKNHIGIIINCAAYTAVDAAENDYFKAKEINSLGPEILAQTGCKLIHISTDYVFDGYRKTPYKPGDETNPHTVYGFTKLLGENAVMKNSGEYVIIRTSWLYSPYGKNFVKTMRNLGATKKVIDVVDDQIGTPTYAADLAAAIVQIIPQINFKNRGVYHYSNNGQCSWCDFAREIMKMSNLNCHVRPTTSSEYGARAVRPKYSVLDKTKIINTFGLQIDDWQSALKRCISEMDRQQK